MDGITVLSPFMLFVDVEYLVEAFNKKGPLSYYEGVVLNQSKNKLVYSKEVFVVCVYELF